jgi:hypothetical protein
MNIEKYNRFDEPQKINEVFVDSSRKLRDAVHDIVSELKSGEEISYKEICKKLKEEFSINISVDLFDKIMDNWWTRRDYSIFKEKDKKWLDPWVYRKIIQKKLKTKVLGKGRRKIEREEREKEWKNRPIVYPHQDPGQYGRQGTLWDDGWIW